MLVITWDNSMNIIKDNNGVRKVETSIIPVIPESSEDLYIRTTSVERLDLMSNKFYGTVSAWKIIAIANALPVNSVFVQPNTRLRIPLSFNRVKEYIKRYNEAR